MELQLSEQGSVFPCFQRLGRGYKARVFIVLMTYLNRDKTFFKKGSSG